MSGNDLVRLWKDPDESGCAAHPAGEITLDDLTVGGFAAITKTQCTWYVGCESYPHICPTW